MRRLRYQALSDSIENNLGRVVQFELLHFNTEGPPGAPP
jgi:hypothetical protein